MNYAALIVDFNDRYAHVFVSAPDWEDAINQLEDIGCEVVENQTDDYDEEDFLDKQSIEQAGLLTIPDLISFTDFAPIQ